MVLVVAENELVVVAALDDVVRLVGQDEAGLAGHGVMYGIENAILAQRVRPVPD
jgi:hypothetical protein